MNRPGFTGMMIVLAVVAPIVMAASSVQAAMAPHFTAKIYELKDHSKQLFDYKSEFEVTGDTKTTVNTVSDLKGEVLVVETTVTKAADGALISFEQDQKQLKTVGKLEIAGEKAKFSFIRDGKTKTDDEKAGADFIMTSTLVPYVQANWEKIVKGETIKARLGVLDRQESVGFQFKKESEKEIGGAAALVVKMKPSSVIISALVNPLFFSFSSDGKKLLELEGRTNVKVMVDGKYKDFDGYTVYAYPSEAPPAAAVPAATPAPTPAPTKSKKKKA